MTIIQATILGVLQGLTEFLPVSSSGHLVITQHYFGLKGHFLLTFDVFVHLGTLSAVLIFFAKDLLLISRNQRLILWFMVLASIPTAILGFGLKGWIDIFFTSLKPVSIALIVNSLLLWSLKYLESAQPKRSGFRWFDAIFIGIAQGLAVIPGISRSGSTITMALWRQVSREQAFRFSFLISIPAILGAMLIVLPESIEIFTVDTVPVLSVGFLASLISGLFALSVLKRVVLSGKIHYFAVYTLFLALVTSYFSWIHG